MAECCHVCGKTPEEPYIDAVGGVTVCRECRSGGELPLLSGAYDALKYIITADPKKLYSFRLPERGLSSLGKAAERYVEAQLDRSFRTLDFYKALI
jgi:DNA repair protein RecO (recombination protein O)